MTMSPPRKNALLNLADALVEDILNMTDEEILAESTPEEIEEAKQSIEKALAAVHGDDRHAETRPRPNLPRVLD
jgi:hypothetical protein